MINPSFKNVITVTTSLLFVLSVTPALFAQKASIPAISAEDKQALKTPTVTGKAAATQSANTAVDALPREEDLSPLQIQARVYRNKGLQMQSIGNINSALSLYQKAIELDPSYAVAYNDLGVLYEAMGDLSRAQECYLKSVKIDPDYLSACSNLAIFYENKRDLRKAAYFWKKRAEAGVPGDPWTEKARKRLDDILLVLGEKTVSEREQDVVELIKDVTHKKLILKYDEKALAKEYFENAKLSYQREQYAEALKQALDAQLLDPRNKAITEFIDKLQTRLLSR